ncbi:MAG: SpoIIE family protein phosphatase [Chloroflexi bacterium]|nr:SpoIIE family protein phosphatase [Chloroflexota bacterium]
MSQTVLFKKVPLLSDLPRSELDNLASTLQIVTLQAGEVLFREDEKGESLFLVLEGQLEVLLGFGKPDEKVMAVLGPGEFIGEMSLLIPGRARTASIRATGAAQLWMMTRADFDALLLRQPKLADTMVRTLTRRLDATNSSAFRELQEKNHQLQKAYDELKAAQVQIIEKERLERELQVAAEIQISILPQELPQVQGYNFGACMVPAHMVGGDLYDVFLLDNERTGVLIGDVADKGIPAAIFMARTHALIMVEAGHGGSPGEILQRVNHHLILHQADQFVTVLFGILDHRNGELDLARAGHELPLLVSAEGRVEIFPHGHGQPIGILDSPLMDEQKITLPSGATLLFFTDGVTDSSNPQGEQFGHEQLNKTLAALAGRSGQETCNLLLETLKRYQADSSQSDDITLVAIHSVKRG